MEELRQFFDTITLCLRECGVSRDIRRVILSQCIFDEFQSRHRSNCIGPAYTRLCLMMLKPKFAQRYIVQIGREANQIKLEEEQRQLAETRLRVPVLLTRVGTDFLLETGLLSPEQLPLNHPSERLGIISKELCTSLLVEYINRNDLMNREHKGFFAVDDRLMALLREHKELVPEFKQFLVWKGEERLHLTLFFLIKLVQKAFICESRLRSITLEITERLQNTSDYVMELEQSRVNKANRLYRNANPL